ncbi:MAG: hypothetical protein GWN39_04760, partial [Thermoplasmata archaeon]|nr:hypothetical protein [Thermoplasmata archaeon]NIU48437.1 hypothetical protein [Thermoplasmata archaeon]NIV78069.1 hypothetical protein [Thermoplasmata archaeon]
MYFAGMTWSEDYPVTPGAVVSEFNLGMNNNQLDGVVTKISSSGDSLLYSTYMGGSSTEWV